MGKESSREPPNPFTPIASDSDWTAKGWADESEPLTVAPRLEAAISIRLDPESAGVVRRAARLSGTTTSAFVRRAAVMEAERVLADAGATPIVISKVRRVDPTITHGPTPPEPGIGRAEAVNGRSRASAG